MAEQEKDRVDDGLARHGHVSYLEIPAIDVEQSATFYEAVFGWQIHRRGSGHASFDDRSGALIGRWDTERPVSRDRNGPDWSQKARRHHGGFFPKKPDWPMQYPSVVIAVDDFKQAVKKVADAGGKVLGEPMEIPGVGQYVSFTDTECLGTKFKWNLGARFCVTFLRRFETRLVLSPRTEKMASGGPGGGNEPPGRRHGGGEILTRCPPPPHHHAAPIISSNFFFAAFAHCCQAGNCTTWPSA
jgi:predicted enzyme related to lactoylglutathione lyase